MRTVAVHSSFNRLGPGPSISTKPIHYDPEDGGSMLLCNTSNTPLPYDDYQNKLNILPDLLFLWPINKNISNIYYSTNSYTNIFYNSF
jgi:hypothetical protein